MKAATQKYNGIEVLRRWVQQAIAHAARQSIDVVEHLVFRVARIVGL